jgi:hypothetical protein
MTIAHTRGSPRLHASKRHDREKPVDRGGPHVRTLSWVTGGAARIVIGGTERDG